MAGALQLDLPYLSNEPDHRGNPRLYVRRYGRRKRLSVWPGQDGFGKAYDAALAALEAFALGAPAAGAGRPPERPAWPKGTLGWLAVQYFGSDEFQALDPTSQRTRRGVIESCLAEPHTDEDPDPMGNCPLEHFDSKKVKRLRDLKARQKLPGAANNRKKYLSAMFGWAIEAEEWKSNPCRDVKRKQYATNGFYTWAISDLATFEAAHPVGTKARLALGLLLYLGVRRGDVVRLGPKMIIERSSIDPQSGEVVKSRVIKFVPNKTRYQRKIESEKPILPALAELLAASAHLFGADTFLETEHAEPFSAAGFGNKMREWCDQAKLPMCSAHGIRKIGATLCAENGATDHQMMAIFDWSTPAQAAIYTRAAQRRKLAAAGMHLLTPHGPGGLH